MLLDKVKEVQLVPESKLLKISPENRMLSRFDKTVYAEEPIPQSIKVSGMTEKYVEAAKFFALLPETDSLEITENYCSLILKNKAEYKLPYYAADWQAPEFDVTQAYKVELKLAADRLSTATLKNLANPVLQCIYIDEATGVSCNSMVACIDGTVTSQKLLILPPDIIGLVEGTAFTLYATDLNYFLKVGDASVFVPVPQLDYSEAAATLRSALPENPEKYPVVGLLDSLKRLSALHETVIFNTDKIVAEDDFEPFNLPNANPSFVYSIQNLLSVVPHVKSITQTDYALLLYGDQYLFMISPEPTEGE